ncbi:MAG TPA: DnaJ domain-containing protein [Clostridiales bacterium]|nr:DnaJ domain-containing protein [Clostridiales bacterium]
MQKTDAYEILGLKSGASKVEIEKRYSIILRKYKSSDNEQSSDINFDEVTEAYNLLMGYTIEETEEERIRRKPNPVLEKMGIDQARQDKLLNNLYYFRIHIVVGIILLVTIILSVKSCVNRVIPNLNIVFMGDIYCSDTENLEKTLKENIPEIEAVGIENILISNAQEKQDPQIQMAMLQKAAVLMAAGDIDVYILDKVNFEKFGEQGAFMKLEDMAKQFRIPDKKLRKCQIKEEDEKEFIYGFDIKDNKILKDASTSGKEMIAVISIKAKNYDNAVKLMELLVQ